MISISKLAENLNVSKQSIYKKINKSMRKELQAHVKKSGAQTLIDEDGAELIKLSLSKGFQPDFQPDFKPELLVENHDIKNPGNPSKNADNLVEFKPEVLVENPVETEAEKEAEKNGGISFFQEQIKSLTDELKLEREYSREQSRQVAELANKLAELTRNSQVLLKQEQERGIRVLDGENKEVNISDEPKGFWQRFWKK